MRFLVNNVANAVAWAVIAVLIGVAAAMADALGFLGLLIVGGVVWLVCIRAEMYEDVPTWSTEVFRARTDVRGSPEQRAARAHERHSFISSLRFYRWCGVVLTIVGLAGFVWQRLH